MGEVHGNFGILPALFANGLVWFGLTQLRGFHPQERVWTVAVERAKILALVNLALAPFPAWWSRWPDEPFFGQSMIALLVSGLALLLCLNYSLRRLAAMLPDETLRADTRLFTALNTTLIVTLGVVVGLWLVAIRLPHVPAWVSLLLAAVDEERFIMVVALALLPLALTMTLIWKAKETLFNGLTDRT
jgi:hypothetical protein